MVLYSQFLALPSIRAMVVALGTAGRMVVVRVPASREMKAGGSGSLYLARWCAALMAARITLFLRAKSGSEERGASGT